MKRYECSKYGERSYIVWDYFENRQVASFPDWHGADDYCERMNREEDQECTECIGYESAMPWMLRQQA